MKINYKTELELAANRMILIHDPDALIKTILSTLVNKIKVEHASALVYEEKKDTYILAVSRGQLNPKVPVGLARMDKDDALLLLFRRENTSSLFKFGVFNSVEAKKLIRKNIVPGLKNILKQAILQMEILEADTCVPCYFGEELLGVLLLGKKNKGKFIKDELNFFLALSSNIAMALKNAQLFKALELELGKKHQLFMRIIVALAAAIEAKDYSTHGHTTRVSTLSLDIARRINRKNGNVFDQQFLEHLHIASLLHDIGKIGIPEDILNKHGILTEEEIKIIREHPLIGATILQPIKELDKSILGVKYHHERYDGNGYPEGLKADEIPPIASIISAADTFDAMTTDRPYRKALPESQALLEIKRLSGTQLNPLAAETLSEIFESK